MAKPKTRAWLQAYLGRMETKNPSCTYRSCGHENCQNDNCWVGMPDREFRRLFPRRFTIRPINWGQEIRLLQSTPEGTEPIFQNFFLRSHWAQRPHHLCDANMACPACAAGHKPKAKPVVDFDDNPGRRGLQPGVLTPIAGSTRYQGHVLLEGEFDALRYFSMEANVPVITASQPPVPKTALMITKEQVAESFERMKNMVVRMKQKDDIKPIIVIDSISGNA